MRAASIGCLASSVNKPSSTALSSVLDPQNPTPSCKMPSAVGDDCFLDVVGVVGAVTVCMSCSLGESARPGRCGVYSPHHARTTAQPPLHFVAHESQGSHPSASG